jgi:hypothetical protein
MLVKNVSHVTRFLKANLTLVIITMQTTTGMSDSMLISTFLASVSLAIVIDMATSFRCEKDYLRGSERLAWIISIASHIRLVNLTRLNSKRS